MAASSGIVPQLPDAELVTVAVLQARLGFCSEARWPAPKPTNPRCCSASLALATCGVRLLRPARKGEPQRAGAHLFRPLRPVIESVNQSFKGQLDLERHGGHTPTGVVVRVLQRILALPPRSGTTTTPASRPPGPCSPTITDDPMESIIYPGRRAGRTSRTLSTPSSWPPS